MRLLWVLLLSLVGCVTPAAPAERDVFEQPKAVNVGPREVPPSLVATPDVEPFVTGVVIDPQTGEPLGDVQVGFACPDRGRDECQYPRTRTDAEGRFELGAPAQGLQRLFVSGEHRPGRRNPLAWYTLGLHEVEVSEGPTGLGTIYARTPVPLGPPPKTGPRTRDRAIVLLLNSRGAYIAKYSATPANLRTGDVVESVDGYRAEDVGAEALRSMFLSDFPFADQSHWLGLRRGERLVRVKLF